MNERIQPNQLRSIDSADLAGEVADILALGLTRLLARKSSKTSGSFGESSLHLLADQSGGRPILENGESQ